MVRLLASILALLALFWAPGAMAADDPVSCIQGYLASAGYPVGKVDGKLGKGTTAYAEEFAQVYPELGLTDLTKANTVEWCTALSEDPAQAILATRTIPAVNAPPETIAKGGGLNFKSPLVLENYGGETDVFHGFTKSLWPGRVVVDTDTARIHSGKTSVRMHLLTGDCGPATDGKFNDCPNTNERVETNGGGTKAKDLHYGFSIMLAANLLDLPAFEDTWAPSDINLYQWFQDNIGACFNVLFNTRKKQLAIDVRCADGDYVNVGRKIYLPDSRTDVWHEFVVQAHWAKDETGFFKVLQNGRMVMFYEGPTLAAGGAGFTAEHPQVYAYGDADGLTATQQYRTPATVWFDDMIRSKTLAGLQPAYAVEESAFADMSSVIQIPGLSPEGDASLLAEGEADRLPEGAILPDGVVSTDVVSGFKRAKRHPLNNAKAYGMVVAPDAAGVTTLHVEVRGGDCGAVEGREDECSNGRETVRVASGDRLIDGQRRTFSWRMSLSPTWAIGAYKQVNLFELTQWDVDREDRIFASSEGVMFQHGKDEPVVLLPPAKLRLDQFHDFEVDVVWSKGKAGRMAISVDGEQTVALKGRTLFGTGALVTFGVSRDGGPPDGYVANFQSMLMAEVK